MEVHDLAETTTAAADSFTKTKVTSAYPCNALNAGLLCSGMEPGVQNIHREIIRSIHELCEPDTLTAIANCAADHLFPENEYMKLLIANCNDFGGAASMKSGFLLINPGKCRDCYSCKASATLSCNQPQTRSPSQ